VDTEPTRTEDRAVDRLLVLDADKLAAEGGGSRIGPITLKFRHGGQVIELTHSIRRATIDGVKVPTWISQRRYGVGGPDMTVVVELRDGSPQLTELTFSSPPGQGEVRQKDLRAVDLDRLATDLYASAVAVSLRGEESDENEQAMRIATKFIERQRLPRDYRVITDDFLKEVAKVYRRNFGRAPTNAVAKAFGVKQRMASTYVDRARKAGHLPRTKQGQKKA
jgi:hypothetical protein